MRKLALTMALVLLMGLVAVPAYAAGPSSTRDDEIQEQLPDPNDPDSPDYVTIDDEDVPLEYVKTEDPDNPGEYIYVPASDLVDIPGDDVPLVESPQTGESSVDLVLSVMAVLCTGALAVTVLPRRKADS